VTPDPLEGTRGTLRVTSGNPTPEELAAILAVLTVAGGNLAGGNLAGGNLAGGASDRWADRERLMPQHWAPGPGAWRTSMLPR